MRWKISLLAVLLMTSGRVWAMDYVVELFEEHYKEQLVTGAGDVKVYHTWQVKTEYGDKLLVLVGGDRHYRAWLRQYAGRHKTFIVKVPDQGHDQFVHSRAVPVDIQQVHSVRDRTWKCKTCRHGAPPPYIPKPQKPAESG